MIPYSRQYLDKKDFYEVSKVLRSKFITQGEKVKLFEKKYVKKLDQNLV